LQTPAAPQALPERKHSFTHFTLRFVPQMLALEKRPLYAEQAGHAWLALSEVVSAALPAPVKRLLLDIASSLPTS
jgi:A/G-specific adenine glycosylase